MNSLGWDERVVVKIQSLIRRYLIIQQFVFHPRASFEKALREIDGNLDKNECYWPYKYLCKPTLEPEKQISINTAINEMYSSKTSVRKSIHDLPQQKIKDKPRNPLKSPVSLINPTKTPLVEQSREELLLQLKYAKEAISARVKYLIDLNTVRTCANDFK